MDQPLRGMDQEMAKLQANKGQELTQLWGDLKEKIAKLLKQYMELAQKDSELQSTREELKKTCRLVEGTKAEPDHERVAFHIEKEGLPHDLNQAQAGKLEADKEIADHKAQV